MMRETTGTAATTGCSISICGAVTRAWLRTGSLKGRRLYCSCTSREGPKSGLPWNRSSPGRA